MLGSIGSRACFPLLVSLHDFQPMLYDHSSLQNPAHLAIATGSFSRITAARRTSSPPSAGCCAQRRKLPNGGGRDCDSGSVSVPGSSRQVSDENMRHEP